MKRFHIYGNTGVINLVKKAIEENTLQSFETYNDMINHFRLFDYMDYQNLNLKWYAYDERIGFDVFMLTADHSGYKDQFLSFVIFN